MFEGSLVESRGLVASKMQKWSAVGSVAVQCAVAAVLIAIPMVRPEMMPVNVAPPQITVPTIKPVQLAQQVATNAVGAATAITLPGHTPVVEQTRGFVFPTAHPTGESEPLPMRAGPMTMGNGSLAPLATIGSVRPAVVPRVRDNRPIRISSGITSGLLLAPIMPVYPPIAKAAHVEGPVVIEAVISKAGRVESLNVVSGPQMLRAAALEAVERARYAPYRLNGEAVDVQTVITVVFRLGA